MMNENAIKNGLICMICRESGCGDCLLKNHKCHDVGFNDVVSIARENYHNLVEKYKRTIFASKEEDVAMKFLKGVNMK